MRILLNAFGWHGNPGDVVELEDAVAAPLLAFGGAHRLDEALEETRRSIVELVDGAAKLLPPEPLRGRAP